ncbi:hypothetical protein MTO98_33205 [Mucilaginibacter sp. SMC90]|uniref:hypothetical protein n=1 Tax=Mucilaginibacter sp. SMC90 TaxID=2929803 RepID=UPI001FB4E7ED|nr:hypothetical protein [Mucilaginibacter sp. SMC90]UOE49254.1 hypothetical protein MTO98_33205 [Mucilaginibacter sp. SMC90]
MEKAEFTIAKGTLPFLVSLIAMNLIIKIAIKYLAIILIWLLLAFYILNETDFVPEFIPYTPIKIGGLIFTFISITTIIFFEKEIIYRIPDLTITRLTFYSAGVWFITELIFQAIRQLTFDENQLKSFLVAVIGMTIFNSIISFLTAFQLKTKRIDRLITYITVILVLFSILIKIFPNLTAS